ncbi:MAG: Lrp/AsnC family transcriptional regulator, partial [Gammaproteobacteria bacterium]|nr:Lrp/AsnC family transcriptional regulator [Gammaproteobacteria bacterium]
MIKLDEYDLKILEILQQDGRISKVRLAEAINLSASPAWSRLQRLEKEGVIRGYHVELDHRQLAAFTRVMVEITLASHQSADFARFEEAIKAIPEIIECQAVGGGVDYLMHIVTRDIDSYQRLIDRLLLDDIGIDKYY